MSEDVETGLRRRQQQANEGWLAGVRAFDDRTVPATRAFLLAAEPISSMKVPVDQTEVSEEVRRREGGRLFGSWVTRSVTRTVEQTEPGYLVYFWTGDQGTTEGPPRPVALNVFVLTSGEILVQGGHHYGQVARQDGVVSSGLFASRHRSTRGAGTLPAFLVPEQTAYGADGPLIPGLPKDAHEFDRTATWFERTLNAFLTTKLSA